jgi:hypothetical protein
MGQIATCKDLSKPDWQFDGQFAVLDPNLIITCAHVCFYSPPSNKRVKVENQPNHRLPFEGLKAAFFESKYEDPIERHIMTSTQIYSVECELVACSGSIDAAVLRLKSPSTLPFQPEPFSILADSLLQPPLPITLVAVSQNSKDPPSFSFIQQPSTITKVSYPSKSHGSKRRFTQACSSYAPQKGYSGAPVVCWMENKFHLAGIHTGTDFLRYNDSSSALPSSSSPSSSAPAPQRNSDSSNSVPSEGEEPPSLIQRKKNNNVEYVITSVNEAVGSAIEHAQNNAPRATFFGAASLLKHPRWSLDALMRAPQYSGPTSSSTSSSPPLSITTTAPANTSTNPNDVDDNSPSISPDVDEKRGDSLRYSSPSPSTSSFQFNSDNAELYDISEDEASS